MFKLMARENMALGVSAVAAALFAVAGITWGLWIDSLVILFDGAYSLVSLLSLLSLYATRIIRRPANEKYPPGRGAVQPLVIAVKGMVITLVCVLSLASAVAAVRSVPIKLWCLPVSVFWAALWSGWAVYADTAMMIVISVYFIFVPVKMTVGAVRELMLAAPSAEVTEEVHLALRAVGLVPEQVRMVKLGPDLMMEVSLPADWDGGTRHLKWRLLRQLTGLPVRPAIFIRSLVG